jgi:DNA-binding GntR family transcriptional regulator
MTKPSPQPSSSTIYEMVRNVLRENLRNKVIPRGFVLLEGPIAEVFQISRVPVKAALDLLEKEQWISRFAGRGYIAGGPGSEKLPIREDFRKLKLVLPADFIENLGVRSAGGQVYSELELQISSCIAFGCFRLVEDNISEHFGVSRTIVREVLARLQERGLVVKNKSSHWIAGPLTAKMLRDLYRIRSLIEPSLLTDVAALLDRQSLQDILELLPGSMRHKKARPKPEAVQVEQRFHTLWLAHIDNPYAVTILRQVQLTLTVHNSLRQHLDVKEDSKTLQEYRAIIELLLKESYQEAKAAFEHHLSMVSARSLEYLKLLAIYPAPNAFPPYLIKGGRSESI